MPADHELSGSSVVVTGGAGFIGCHAVRALLARGVREVRVIDSLRYGDPENLAELERVKLVQHTLGSDPAARLVPVLAGTDFLLHLAAEKHNQSKDSPARVIQANITGTHELLQVAGEAGVKKVVFSSSLYAYGRMQGPPFSEREVPEPSTIYGISKLAGEHLCRMQSAAFGFEWCALRYLFVYGPRQWAGQGYKSVIVKSAERLLAGEPPVVFGDGEQALDYVFVDDVVEATLAALTRRAAHAAVINVGSGEATSVNRLLDVLIQVSGISAEKTAGPADWTAGSCRVGRVERAAELLGWRSTTNLEQGLARTYAWLARLHAGGQGGSHD